MWGIDGRDVIVFLIGGIVGAVSMFLLFVYEALKAKKTQGW